MIIPAADACCPERSTLRGRSWQLLILLGDKIIWFLFAEFTTRLKAHGDSISG
jgi:hypothetical protein